MSTYMNQELVLFASSVWAGVLLTAAYDLLRIFRRVCSHQTFWVGFEDLLYWMGAGVFLFATMYEKNDGIIRLYALVGIGVGVLLYHYSLSGILVKYISLFLNKMKDFLNIPFKMAKKVIKMLKLKLSWVRIQLENKKSFKKVRKKINERRDKKGEPGEKKKKTGTKPHRDG